MDDSFDMTGEGVADIAYRLRAALDARADLVRSEHLRGGDSESRPPSSVAQCSVGTLLALRCSSGTGAEALGDADGCT